MIEIRLMSASTSTNNSDMKDHDMERLSSNHFSVWTIRHGQLAQTSRVAFFTVFWGGAPAPPQTPPIYLGGAAPPHTLSECRPLASLFIGDLIGLLLNIQ